MNILISDNMWWEGIILRIYVVRQGDSIWSIAKRNGVTPQSIIETNQMNNSEVLVVGQTLVIPSGQKAKNYGYIETNAFIQPSTPEKERRVMGEAIEYLTYITPFSHHVNEDASLTPLNDEVILQLARENKTAPLLSVTNISGANFDTDLISKILNSETLSQNLIGNILTLIKSKGYYGVVIDFERIPPADRNKYSDFLRKL